MIFAIQKFELLCLTLLLSNAREGLIPPCSLICGISWQPWIHLSWIFQTFNIFSLTTRCDFWWSLNLKYTYAGSFTKGPPQQQRKMKIANLTINYLTSLKILYLKKISNIWKYYPAKFYDYSFFFSKYLRSSNPPPPSGLINPKNTW